MILIGWSWDICAKDINNIRINIVFQTITYLLGNEFIKEWLNNKSNLADYLMLAYDKLIENNGGDKRRSDGFACLAVIFHSQGSGHNHIDANR